MADISQVTFWSTFSWMKTYEFRPGDKPLSEPIVIKYVTRTQRNKMIQYFPAAFHIDGLVQDCSNSSALAMELLQSCTKPSIFPWQTDNSYR